MRVTLVSACLGAFLALQPGTAWSLSATAVRAAVNNCQADGIDPDARIEACSELIHSNLATSHFLAAFYLNRGIAYEVKRDLDDAKKDFDKALELKPDYQDALVTRADLLDKMGDHAAAQADTARAEELKAGAPKP